VNAPSSPAKTPSCPSPLASGLERLWKLDPAYRYLNHGSFGAVPRSIAQECTAAQDRIEGRPIELLGRRIHELLAPSRARVAAFLGVAEESFGFVTNATEAMNGVLRSLEFRPGDELLTTNHVYNAVRKTMSYRARQCGAVYREARLELPVVGPDALLQSLLPHMTDRTRLIVVDQITSPTALALLVKPLAAECSMRGIELMIDGAHAPGMVDFQVPDLGATYWTGNLHKWCCAPKGTGVLWVNPSRIKDIHPSTVSHFLDEGFCQEFEWQGTRDIAPWMTAGSAIDFMGQWGWDRVRAHNQQLSAWAHRLLCLRWDVEPISPIDGSMLGSMCTVPLPPEVRAHFKDAPSLQLALYQEHRIEAAIVEFDDRWFVRSSAQIYNRADDYEALAQAVLEFTRRV
jgi:isopenicillin-N epimerase